MMLDAKIAKRCEMGFAEDVSVEKNNEIHCHSFGCGSSMYFLQTNFLNNKPCLNQVVPGTPNFSPFLNGWTFGDFQPFPVCKGLVKNHPIDVANH